MMTNDLSRRGLLGMAAAATAGAGIASLSTAAAAGPAFATGLSGNVSDGLAGMNSRLTFGISTPVTATGGWEAPMSGDSKLWQFV